MIYKGKYHTKGITWCYFHSLFVYALYISLATLHYGLVNWYGQHFNKTHLDLCDGTGLSFHYMILGYVIWIKLIYGTHTQYQHLPSDYSLLRSLNYKIRDHFHFQCKPLRPQLFYLYHFGNFLRMPHTCNRYQFFFIVQR